MIKRSNGTKCYEMKEVQSFFIKENKTMFMKYLNDGWIRCAVCQLIFATQHDGGYAICSEKCEDKMDEWAAP